VAKKGGSRNRGTSPEADAANMQPALRRNAASKLSLKNVFWMFLFMGSFQTKANCIKTGRGLPTQFCSGLSIERERNQSRCLEALAYSHVLSLIFRP